jgi:hypothetical protein
MKQIISVSRRTDIPALYGDWFFRRVKEGYAGYINPYGGQNHFVSLKPHDVLCFVFWSKDFIPFTKRLKELENSGYSFYFNYTITGLPEVFEPNLPNTEEAINCLKTLSKSYSPQHINWRYDPIILSTETDYQYHLSRFRSMACSLKGYVKRCIISFVHLYSKIRDRLRYLQVKTKIRIIDTPLELKQRLANELAIIAQENGIELFSCCGDYLVNDSIRKAHCIDGILIGKLFNPAGLSLKIKPTRSECGCTESRDIGEYNTCTHGCVYCYAYTEIKKAIKAFKNHDPESPFLGPGKRPVYGKNYPLTV